MDEYPAPLEPAIEQASLELAQYRRIGNSYQLTDDRFVILHGGHRFELDLGRLGEQTVIRTDAGRSPLLDEYVLDAESVRLLQDGISLSHVATVADDDGAMVLTGPPNTGKTGIALAMTQQDWSFMADEEAPLTTEGEAIPLAMPIAVGNQNIAAFRELLDDLEIPYSRLKSVAMEQLRRLPVPLVGKALDRLVDPVSVDPTDLPSASERRDISTAVYLQPESRDDIVIESMETDAFVDRLALWDRMQRSGLQELYDIWSVETGGENELIESMEATRRSVLGSCFDSVEVLKARVPLDRRPRAIGQRLGDL